MAFLLMRGEDEVDEYAMVRFCGEGGDDGDDEDEATRTP
jgi:hypothetical protein